MIFQGTRTSVAKKLYIFVIFQGGGCPKPLLLPLDPRTLRGYRNKLHFYKFGRTFLTYFVFDSKHILLDFSLIVKAATLIFISGCG